MGLLVPVTLYTRVDCTLCEEAEAVVTEFASRFPLVLEFRDVDANPEWRQNFGQEVPVVFVGDRKLFRYRIDAETFTDTILNYLDAGSNDDKT
jgi:hypothetical protein